MGFAVAVSSSRSLGLFGLGISSIVNAVLSALTSWVLTGTKALVVLFGHALNTTTSVRFSSGFLTEFDLLRTFGAELAGLFLVAVVLQALFARDLGLLGRAFAIGLPVALLGSSIAIEIVAVLVRVTDGISADLISSAGRSVGNFLAAFSAVVVGTALSQPIIATSAALALGLVLSLVVFCCWLELVLRAGAILVASLFLPLALAGAIWPVTRHWIRRLSETIVALVLSKAVIAAIFALAISSIGSPGGLGTLIEGLALFVLCAIAPFSMLRLLPFAEAGAIAHLESASNRGSKLARSAAPVLSDRLFPAEAPGVEQREGVSHLAGDPSLRIAVDREDIDRFSFLGPFVVEREPGESGAPEGEVRGRPPERRFVETDRGDGK